MAKIVEFTPNIQSNRQQAEQRQQRKERTQAVATGVGVTGYGTAAATNYASKRGILGSMMNRSQSIARTAGNINREATGLFSNFFRNTRKYTADIIHKLNHYEEMRFIGPIVKNPIVQKMAGGLGVVMAFFVLITGLRKSAETGAMAINDAKHRYRVAA
ncbi:hypothetical protein IJ579_08430 [bacterium]|nr:hypothetical protein [bacterium]